VCQHIPEMYNRVCVCVCVCVCAKCKGENKDTRVLGGVDQEVI